MSVLSVTAFVTLYTSQEIGVVYMLALLLFLAFLVMGLCLTKGEGRRRFLADVAALLYLPIGTLVSLLRRCK